MNETPPPQIGRIDFGMDAVWNHIRMLERKLIAAQKRIEELERAQAGCTCFEGGRNPMCPYHGSFGGSRE